MACIIPHMESYVSFAHSNTVLGLLVCANRATQIYSDKLQDKYIQKTKRNITKQNVSDMNKNDNNNNNYGRKNLTQISHLRNVTLNRRATRRMGEALDAGVFCSEE